jgi:hypothetical protein
MKRYFPFVFCLLFAASLGAGALTLAWSAPDSDSKPAAEALEARPKLLHIAATVDGSGRIVFTRGTVHYEHRYWAEPTDMTFDGTPWDDLSETPNAWRQIAANYDLSKARIVRRDGRDMIALETTPEGFDLYLCDSPNGSDHYEVTISIPPRS